MLANHPKQSLNSLFSLHRIKQYQSAFIEVLNEATKKKNEKNLNNN